MKIKFIVLFFFTVLAAQAQPSISFTFDDGVTNDMPGYTFDQWNEMILNHLDDDSVKAIAFKDTIFEKQPSNIPACWRKPDLGVSKRVRKV